MPSIWSYSCCKSLPASLQLLVMELESSSCQRIPITGLREISLPHTRETQAALVEDPLLPSSEYISALINSCLKPSASGWSLQKRMHRPQIADWPVYLRRGQTNTVGLVHGFPEVSDEWLRSDKNCRCSGLFFKTGWPYATTGNIMLLYVLFLSAPIPWTTAGWGLRLLHLPGFYLRAIF